MADSSQNPYLALLQQEQGPPSWAQVLQHIGNLGFGLAGGFGQAAATGQPTMSAIGPGLMMGNQLNAQAAHQAEQERMKRLELQFKAQEHEDKRAELLRNQAAIDAYVKAPGFQVSPTQGPLMGPSGTTQPAQPGPDLKTGGAPIVDYLMTKHGLSPLAASTVAGNLYQESSFNPANDRGDSGTAFGLAQWRLDRQTGLRNFAAAQNKPVTDPQLQLDYLVAEMKGGDMGAQRAYAGLQQARTPEEANAAMMHFFRPAGYTPANPTGGHGYGQRVANTRALLPNGQPAPQGGPQVAQGDAAPTQPQPRPGPTLSALPAFQGPGMGTIQPGALPEGVVPSVNMPSPAVTQSGAPIDPNAQPPPFMQPGGAGPNVVQAQYQPQPGQPSMAPGGAPAPGGSAAPPTFVPPPMRDIPPEVNAQINRLVGLPRGVGLTIQQAEDKKHQLRVEQWRTDTEAAKAQHATALEVYKQQEESRRHERGLTEQKAAEQRRLETELVTVRDRTTNELKSVTKAEAVSGVSSGQFIPLDAESAKRAEEAAALARENAARAAANQDVNIDPATGQPVINEKAVEAKTRISAAQGTDQSSKIQFELAQDAIKRNSDWQKTGAAAGATIRNMAMFDRLSDEVKTGKYAGATTDLKAALKGAGVNLEAWGIPDNVAPAQAMQMMSQRFALEMRQEMPGPMSDGDRKFMERGSISIENDPNANKIMAAWIKGNAERAQDRAKFAREYIRSGDFKTDPAGIDDYVEQKLAQKDYFDHSVLPKEAPAAKTGWELEVERRGNMNSAKPR